MAKEVLTVRDVDEELWRRFRAKTEEEGLRTGQALNEALDVWIKRKERTRKRPNPSSFLKVAGMIKAGRRVRWSEEIDKVLYGEEV
jgi:RPA family protein